MKKFLFTLAALMMAGSAFALNVITYPDTELTEAQIGSTIQCRMTAEFDNYVSGFRINFYDMPEGVTITKMSTGNGYKMSYINEDGDEDTYSPTLMANNPVWLTASQQQAWDENGTYMGVAHWTPGNHADFLRVTFSIPAGFKGGTINYWVEPTSGGWGDHSNDCPSGSHHECSFEFTVPAGPVEPTAAPTPVINYDETTGLVTATCDGPNTVQLYLNGNPVDQPFDVNTVEQTWEAQTLTFTATTQPGENETATSTEEPTIVTIPAKQPVPAPAPEIGYNEAGQVVATAEGHTVQLYLNGNPVAQPYTLPAATWETQTLSFTAVTQPNAHETATESVAPFVVTIDPLQPTAAPKPNLVQEDGQVVASCEGHEVVLMLEGEVVANPYTLPAATDVEQVLHFTATTVPGEHEVAGEAAELTVTIPAAVTPELPTCLAPNSSYVITGTEEATVTIVNREDGATVNVQVYVNGVLDEDLSTTFTGETYSFTVTGDATYEVHAIATKDGYNNSADGGVFFTITEGEQPTGIDELVNGKQIAGVRYFNMAGQEMQEANGMTIVVTTYTDGTTSAVKVMK